MTTPAATLRVMLETKYQEQLINSDNRVVLALQKLDERQIHLVMSLCEIDRKTADEGLARYGDAIDTFLGISAEQEGQEKLERMLPF